ncbi:MAG TPA: ABC transporter ATP-binding protein [Nitrososphaerales archaeon]|nr:ABC transporter ATP-binding protein [Nitrososphaerales archaeon]HUK75446.1 ABC transporter ATP-binding protein [Nitrososphaerales archaeon]
MGWPGFGGAGGHGVRGTGSVIEGDDARTTSDWVLIKRLLRFMRQSRRYLVYITLALAVFTFTTVVGPILTGDAIDLYIFPNGVLGTDFDGLALVAGVYVAITVTMFVAEYTQTYFMAKTGQAVIYTLRREAFDKLQRVSLKYFNERPIGAVISHVTNDVDVLNDFLAFQSTQLISGTFSIVGIMAVMLVINWQLALYSLTIVPMLIVMILALQKRMKRNWMNTRRSMGVLTAKVAESLAGIKVTQSFAAEGDDKEEFTATNRRNMQSNVEAAKISSVIGPAAQLIQSLGIFAVFYFGALMVTGGQIQIGVLATFYIWLNNLFRPIQQLTLFYPQYQSAMVGLDRVCQIIDAEVDVNEAPDAAELKDPEGAIDYNHVSFRYKPGEPNALSDIDVHVLPREIIALVGQTGAGKSTFVNLLFRFYDPDEGTVLLDGQDLRKLTFKSLRTHMAIVLQDPFLFSNTVMENIRYGNLNATDDQIVQAAKDVGLDEFIRGLPNGYRTQIRESATNISTGQKQLLSLARALVADPKVLVLDEATSKVDPHTELLIQRALDRVFKGRTTIIIAHRLSTIRMADRILLLDHGRIAEQGSQEELMEKGGAYAKLYKMQFEGPLPAQRK